MKSLFNFLFAFMLATILVAVCTPIMALAVSVLTVFSLSILPRKVEGFGAPVVLTELFTGELIKKFRHVGKWLSVIPSEDKYVNNNVIHLVDVGADPSVLVNNTTYPIAVNARSDEDLPVALKKFETTNTKITDDELYALSYDKVASVVEQHREVLEEVTAQYGLHSLAPASNTANTPIISTTGADNGGGRKRLTIADIAKAKIALDNLKVPLENRILVLCNDHLNDLILIDQPFRDKYINTVTGQAISFMGFQIYQDVFNPVYNGSNVKKAIDAVAAPSTDRNASTLFYAPRAFKAQGTVKMYYRQAELDPENRQTVAGFRLYHIVLPKKNLGFGAIVSDAM